MKATEQYFPVVLFIMLFRLVLHFVSVHVEDQVLEQSNEALWTLLSSRVLCVSGNSRSKRRVKDVCQLLFRVLLSLVIFVLNQSY